MATPRRTIKVPLELAEAIHKFVAKNKGFYRSRPEEEREKILTQGNSAPCPSNGLFLVKRWG